MKSKVRATGSKPQPKKSRKANPGWGESKSGSTQLLSAPVATGMVRYNAGKRTSIMVPGKEVVATCVSTGTAFNIVAALAIQPAKSSAFPWLSRNAQNYDEYRVVKMKYVFESVRPTSDAGSVLICYDPDVLNQTPESFVVGMSYQAAVEGPSWSPSLELRLDPKVMMQGRSRLFTRPGGLTYGDYLNFDAGAVYVACEGNVVVGTIGRLICEYVIELIAPQTISNPVGLARGARYTTKLWLGATTAPIAVATFVALPLTTSDAYNPLGLVPGATGVICPAGMYEVYFYCTLNWAAATPNDALISVRNSAAVTHTSATCNDPWAGPFTRNVATLQCLGQISSDGTTPITVLVNNVPTSTSTMTAIGGDTSLGTWVLIRGA